MQRNRHRFRTALTVAACVAVTGTSIAAEQQAANLSPKEVCTALIEAAKKNDFKSVQMYTLHRHERGRPRHHGMQQGGRAATPRDKSEMAHMERNFHQMRKNHMETLKDMSCGSEHIAGDHAMVEAEAKGSKVFVPFVQMNGKWLFDAPTYMTFYRAKVGSGSAGKASG